jgi:hypothetical protein
VDALRSWGFIGKSPWCPGGNEFEHTCPCSWQGVAPADRAKHPMSAPATLLAVVLAHEYWLKNISFKILADKSPSYPCMKAHRTGGYADQHCAGDHCMPCMTPSHLHTADIPTHSTWHYSWIYILRPIAPGMPTVPGPPTQHRPGYASNICNRVGPWLSRCTNPSPLFLPCKCVVAWD